MRPRSHQVTRFHFANIVDEKSLDFFFDRKNEWKAFVYRLQNNFSVRNGVLIFSTFTSSDIYTLTLGV